MIDLHIHTTYSDGSKTPIEILQESERLRLEVIAITDHDSILAYKELSKINIKKYYSGKIITGVEFTTTFDGYTTEILGYGCDYKKINKVLKRFYNNRFLKRQQKDMAIQMKKIINDHNLIFDFNDKKHCESFKAYYNELRSHKENFDKVPSGLLDTFKYFLRKGYANPNSDFFVDKSNFYLKFEDIIELIHKAGGKAFLAHPYIYRFPDTIKKLNKIFNNTELDGLECYYHSFDKEQTESLLNFAKERNLLVCGGTDYHGDLRPESKLGIGQGNMNISKDIIENWHINFFE